MKLIDRILVAFALSSIISASWGAVSAEASVSQAVVDLGTAPRMSALYEKVNATYRVETHDGRHIKWLFGGSSSSDSANISLDGRLVISSSARFDPASRDLMDREIGIVLDLLNSTGSKATEEMRLHAARSTQYYSEGRPVDAMTWNQCGNTLANKGKFAESLFYYNKAIEADPEIADVLNNKGAALRRLGKSKDAIKCYDTALGLEPEKSIVWGNKGEALYRMGKKTEALDCFNQSCKLDQKNAYAWYGRGVILSEMKRYDDALESYNRSTQADPYGKDAWNNKGVIQARLGRLDDAMVCFQNAATLDMGYIQAMVNGGIVLREQGERKKAEEIFAQASKLRYNNTEDYYQSPMPPPSIIENSVGRSPGTGSLFAIASILVAGWTACLKRRLRSRFHTKQA